MIGQAFHWANLTVAFLLELCALAALGYWGLRTASEPAAKAALGIDTGGRGAANSPHRTAAKSGAPIPSAALAAGPLAVRRPQ